MRISDWSSDVCSSDLPEIDRWIDEGGDRSIGNGKDRGCLVERQADAEMIVRDRQVPVAVLEHDRHIVGIFGGQMGRNSDPWGLRLEGDVKMMLAGMAVAALDMRQQAADHGARRVMQD